MTPSIDISTENVTATSQTALPPHSLAQSSTALPPHSPEQSSDAQLPSSTVASAL